MQISFPVIARLPFIVILFLITDTLSSRAQTAALDFPDKAISSIEKKYSSLNDRLNKQLAKALARSKKQEAKLQKKLQAKDSTAAAQLFTNTQAEYDKLQQQLKNPLQGTRVSNYIPRLDSLQTAGKFLEQSGILNNSKLNEVKQLNGELQKLEGSLHSAEQIEAYLKQRKELLTAQLQKLGMTKELTQLKKQVYYYRQQIEEYKSLFNDQQKLEQKALSLLRELPAFQEFFNKYSELGRMFNLSGNTTALSTNLSRNVIENEIAQRLGAGTDISNTISAGTSAAQAQAPSLNNILEGTNSIGDQNIEMPPYSLNQQKTKPFFKRVELGFNVQSTGANKYLPSTAEIAATAGYKACDYVTAGLGISYHLGFGRPVKNIRLSNEGIGFRSFVDVKMKKVFWLTAGAEYNYMQSFAKLKEVHDNVDVWKRSALVGLTVKCKTGKKYTNIQLLYDLLWKTQIPNIQPIRFRVGFSY